VTEGERYRTLFERLPSGAMRCRVVFDGEVATDCIFLEVNGAFAKLNPADLVDRRASEIIPRFLRGPTFAAYVRVVKTGVAERFEGRGDMLANQWFQFAVDRTGPDEIIALIEDITERKRAELRLVTQYEVSRALADAEGLADAVPRVLAALANSEGLDFGAMWLVDATGEQLRFVGLWQRDDLDAAQLVAETRTMSFARGVGLPGRVLATGEHVLIDDVTREPGYLRADAARRAGLVASRAFPIVHGERVLGVIDVLWRTPPPPDPRRRELGAAIGLQLGQYVARAQAVAALRKLNQELELRVAERTAQLEATNRELESFSYSVSHDLRAPLRAINGYAAILVEDHGAVLPPDAHRLLETIRGRGAHMGVLIDDLLEFSRLGRRQVRRHDVDMTALVTAIAQELAATGPARIDIAPLPVAIGDGALLRQVWTNLVENALKYARGRATPIVEIGFAAGAYTIRDNGVGFDMRYANKLFGVFQRLHREDEFEGTGVGLAIVRRIVESHGGRVWAEAAIGLGATFHFTLEPSHG